MKYAKKTDFKDLDQITRLVNSAYRSDVGNNRWTSETGLVQGHRLSLALLELLITDADVDLYLGYLDDRLAGCIAITFHGDISEFGTFAVAPELHNTGIGKALLSFAEGACRTDIRMFQVAVVSLNQDLIRFYERRGYRRTGAKIPFPAGADVGKPTVEKLDLTVMQKRR
ncbi:MAG: GNAT family N-acetyltransferase [Pseudomonadota bacterium]|nr:GNAT family N-acetyltransferase [Pseudomonadota bacterium]